MIIGKLDRAVGISVSVFYLRNIVLTLKLLFILFSTLFDILINPKETFY